MPAEIISEYVNSALRTRSVPYCYLCSSKGRPLYSDIHDRLFSAPGTWSLLRCNNRDCGLVWLDPQPEPEEIGRLYPNYFTNSTPSRLRARTALRAKLRSAILAHGFGYKAQSSSAISQFFGLLASRIGVLNDIVGGSIMWLPAASRGRLLDVGCGNGPFLAQMKDLGWVVTGVEPDPVAADLARRHFGLEVKTGTVEDGHFAEQSFDVITMSHVIEHLLNPIGTLRECRKLLSQGGHLLLVTPNIRSLACRRFGLSWVHWDPPRHLYLFSQYTLAETIRRAGLTVEHISTTARIAGGAWLGSSLIRRHGKADGASLPVARNGMTEILFQLTEHVANTILSEQGEEVHLVARKD